MPRRDRRAPSATGSTRVARPRRLRSLEDERALGTQRARQVVEALQAEAFEELPCRTVQDGATGGLFATALLDEPPRRERVVGLVAVHASDRFDVGAGKWLAVGNHGNRFR